MTDKEFKRLSRVQLIEVIYQLQLQIDALTEDNKKLAEELADKRLRIENAGSIAAAALELNNCFQSAQNAADQYLSEIRAIHNETEAQREKILADARAQAAEIIAVAERDRTDLKTSTEGHDQNSLNNG